MLVDRLGWTRHSRCGHSVSLKSRAQNDSPRPRQIDADGPAPPENDRPWGLSSSGVGERHRPAKPKLVEVRELVLV